MASVYAKIKSLGLRGAYLRSKFPGMSTGKINASLAEGKKLSKENMEKREKYAKHRDRIMLVSKSDDFGDDDLEVYGYLLTDVQDKDFEVLDSEEGLYLHALPKERPQPEPEVKEEEEPKQDTSESESESEGEEANFEDELERKELIVWKGFKEDEKYAPVLKALKKTKSYKIMSSENMKALAEAKEYHHTATVLIPKNLYHSKYKRVFAFEVFPGTTVKNEFEYHSYKIYELEKAVMGAHLFDDPRSNVVDLSEFEVGEPERYEEGEVESTPEPEDEKPPYIREMSDKDLKKALRKAKIYFKTIDIHNRETYERRLQDFLDGGRDDTPEPERKEGKPTLISSLPRRKETLNPDKFLPQGYSLPGKYREHVKFLISRFYPDYEVANIIDSTPDVDSMLKRSLTSPDLVHIYNYDTFEKVGDSLLKYCLYDFFLGVDPRIQQDALHNISARYNSKVYQSLICEALSLERYAVGNPVIDMSLKEDLVEAFFGVVSHIFGMAGREDLKIKVTRAFFAKLFSGEEVYTFKDDVSLVTQDAQFAITEKRADSSVVVKDLRTNEYLMDWSVKAREGDDLKLIKFDIASRMLNEDWVQARIKQREIDTDEFSRIIGKNVTEVVINNQTNTVRLIIDDEEFLKYKGKIYIKNFSRESLQREREGSKLQKSEKLDMLKEDLRRKFK